MLMSTAKTEAFENSHFNHKRQGRVFLSHAQMAVVRFPHTVVYQRIRVFYYGREKTV